MAIVKLGWLLLSNQRVLLVVTGLLAIRLIRYLLKIAFVNIFVFPVIVPEMIGAMPKIFLAVNLKHIL